MPTHLVAATEFNTSKWSGGSSTQLWIYPKGSSLEARDFAFRLSSAQVESSGPFSDFSGYDRLLILLQGRMELTFRPSGQIKALAPDSEALHFDGGTEVYAELLSGSVTDFNLFVPNGIAKEATRLKLGPQQRWHQPPMSGAKIYGVYLRQGCLIAGEALVDSEYPLIISSMPLTVLTEAPSDLIAFAIGHSSSPS